MSQHVDLSTPPKNTDHVLAQKWTILASYQKPAALVRRLKLKTIVSLPSRHIIFHTNCFAKSTPNFQADHHENIEQKAADAVKSDAQAAADTVTNISKKYYKH